jgi:hypothetical protein
MSTFDKQEPDTPGEFVKPLRPAQGKTNFMHNLAVKAGAVVASSGEISERRARMNFDSAIASMAGQTLYELYVRKMKTAQIQSPKWKDIGPNTRRLWQELAQDFLKVAE